MEVKVSRDSVCMGDDAFDHTKAFCFDDDNATCEDLFELLKKEHYFPSVSGNNVVWVLTADGYECIFSYFTKTDRMNLGLVEKSIRKLCGAALCFHFKYYSSPEEWKKKIVSMYQDDTYAMWKDGWLDEVKYCDFVTSYKSVN